MRHDFLIYPQALQKLKDSGLEERVLKIKESEYGLRLNNGYIGPQDIAESVSNMKDEGYYNTLPQENDFANKYKKNIQQFFGNPKNYFWTIERNGQIIKEPCELNDLELFIGEIPSIILSKDEIWDYKKFGFNSPIDLVGTLTAFMMTQSNKLDRHGYSWTTKHKSGDEMTNCISGDHNLDLVVEQKNLRIDKTLDPFLNEVGYRPLTHNDVKYVSAYHSTEPYLLVAVLKYAEQQKIHPAFFDDKAQCLIEWAKTISEGSMNAVPFGEEFFNARSLLINHAFPIPLLDKNNCTQERSIHSIFCQNNGSYNSFITHDGNLVFAYESYGNAPSEKKKYGIIYEPSDVEEIVKGILYQSIKHLGRTSPNTIIEILNYRFSDTFKLDMVEMLK